MEHLHFPLDFIGRAIHKVNAPFVNQRAWFVLGMETYFGVGVMPRMFPMRYVRNMYVRVKDSVMIVVRIVDQPMVMSSERK